ncbi:GNAT family N-acetyltransferase [Pseudobdellovibrio sp. HCB154]|uniref:GNAT family N-acetyltransferase n=1 Tax=Pseudobdellovibrio sp. HCB154 TaxID=3386277 RepID=UPI003917491B
MLKPRSPEQHEFDHVVDFLNHQLRADSTWPINSEYPTALTPSNIHNMSIIEEGGSILSHALIKPIITKTPYAIYKIGAIGSVVTDPSHRQQGLSTLNMQNCLAKATAQDCDLVMLWTDKTEFYQKFGFELAGFEHTYVIDKPLPTRSENIRIVKGTQVDPQALLKLYSQHSVASVRTLDEVQQYLKIPNANVYTAWSNTNQLLAYAVDGKGADLQTFIHEWAGQIDALLDIVSHIVKTENQPYHLMVPQHAKNLRKVLDDLQVFSHRGFLAMIRIHNFEAIATKVKKAFRAEGYDQIVLEKQHGQIVFGYGQDLYTLDEEADLAKILFGPATIDEMTFIKPETRKVLATILPLPLWVWGWDSI